MIHLLSVFIMKLYIVRYTGKFAFIKPWTAVRDIKTFSQQFLTQSTVEGIEKKLFPELLSENGKIRKILRYKLSYDSVVLQQEQTQTRGWNCKKGMQTRPRSILNRGVLLNPVLYLAFGNMDDAEAAASQHICLCRNEDILLPDNSVTVEDERQFQSKEGFELRFGQSDKSFLVGYSRYDGKPMFGWLEINGKSIIGE